ncbi:type II secretion system protein GspM [Variovorax gossypii]
MKPLRSHPALQWLREGKARWQALPPRDRLAASAAAIVLVLAVLWLFATKPALETLSRWQRDLPRLQAQSRELDEVLSGMPAAHAAQGTGLSEPPQTGLDRAGLQGAYRIELIVADAPPDAGKAPPAKAWRIAFERPAPADKVFPWLLAISARADLEVTGVVLDRKDGTDGNDPQASVRGVVDLQSTQLYKDGP